MGGKWKIINPIPDYDHSCCRGQRWGGDWDYRRGDQVQDGETRSQDMVKRCKEEIDHAVQSILNISMFECLFGVFLYLLNLTA